MNKTVFFIVLLAGWMLIELQWLSAWAEGWATQAQLRARGVKGWSFWEHGGVVGADVFLIAPGVAYAFSKYRFDILSWRGFLALLWSAAIVLVLVELYRRQGMAMGDHCTHDGRTVFAGWVHALFSFVSIWTFMQVYLGWTTPEVSSKDLLIFSTLLTPFWFLGIAKFSREWVFDLPARIQVAGGTLFIWVITGIRLWRQ